MSGPESPERSSVDLNADLGEECGDDAAMLRLVSSANIAAGGHAGGGAVLDWTVAQARALGVAIGAHPSYPDRTGFGRRSLADRFSAADLADVVAGQVAAVDQAARAAGTRMVQVKAHGALYTDAAVRPDLAHVVAAAVRLAVPDRPVALLGPPGSALESAALAAGLPFLSEGFADRRYAADGSLVPRDQPNAVLADPAAVGAQAVALATGAALAASDGSPLCLQVRSVCLHGDTPGAVAFARRTRTALEAAGIAIRAPWAS